MEMNENNAETPPPTCQWHYPTTIHAYRRTFSRPTWAAFGDIDKTRRWFGKASSSWEWLVERDLDQWMALKNREELDQFGWGIWWDTCHRYVYFAYLFSTLIYLMFVFHISSYSASPLYISYFHRINSVLSLLLRSAYMQSFAILAPSPSADHFIIVTSQHPTASNQDLVVAITTIPTSSTPSRQN